MKKKPAPANTTWQTIKRYDFRGAIEKILFTTVGLLLALWINNWNDGRKERKEEIQILKALQSTLRQDSSDVIETYRDALQYRLLGHSTVLDNLTDTATVTDSLCVHLQYLLGQSFLLANTSAYENLKAKGFSMIDNDSLRLAIVTLYDVDYERIQQIEALFDIFYNKKMSDYALVHFSRCPKGLMPLSWKKQVTDNQFRELILNNQYHYQTLLSSYKALEIKINQILKGINQELANK